MYKRQVIKGFAGNILGKATYEIDNISSGVKKTITDSAGTAQKYVTRKTFVLKPNAYLLAVKQMPVLEEGRDMLGRTDFWMITHWYTFYPLHKVNNDEDVRAGGLEFITSEETA